MTLLKICGYIRLYEMGCSSLCATFSPLLPIGQEGHAKGLLHHHLGIVRIVAIVGIVGIVHHHLGVVLPLHSARLRHHEQEGLFRLDQSWTVSLLEALSVKESSHSCACVHTSASVA